MSPDSMVVEDGIDEAGSDSRYRSRWFIFGAGFVFGLALGVVIVVPGGPESGDASGEGVDGAGVFDTHSQDSGISGAVPGFPDALVAIADGPGSGLEHVLWPLRGPIIGRPMTHGNDVRIDASGDYYAISIPVPGLGGAVLSMGRSSDVRPVRAGVTSYAWHDTKRGQLVFTTEDDEGWQLFRVTPSLVPEVVATAGYPGGSVVSWGDWGYAIQVSEDEVALLTAAGELKDRETGRALASHGSGWVLVEDGSLKLVSSGGGVRQLNWLEPPGHVFSAAFSPDRHRLAIASASGLTVLELDEQTSVTFTPHRGPWMSWSSDSRFLMTPSQTGIAIHDSQTPESHHLLLGRNVVAAASAPLSSP
jgi:hypothetical protein